MRRFAMNKKPLHLRISGEHVLAVLVLAILMAYSYARFFVLPYAGFEFDPSNGDVIQVFAGDVSDAGLQVGDQILQVGSVRWRDYDSDLRLTLIDTLTPGEALPITILREGQEITVDWTIPETVRGELFERFQSVLSLAYLFWAAGIGTLLLVRPRDERWRLMLLFFFLTALWLACGSLSSWHFWYSAILLRVAIWISVPVYLHLHWVFPKPLKPLPPNLVRAAYLLGILLAFLQVFQALPKSLYYLGFLVAILGSVALVMAHFALQPSMRRDLLLLFIAVLLALLPPVGLGLAGLSGELPLKISATLLSLPLLPGAYFYVLYRGQYKSQELRANRLAANYVFIVLFGSLFIVLVPLSNNLADSPNQANLINLAIVLIAALVGGFGFSRFQRFFDHRILGIPLEPDHLLETYSDRIVTSLDIPGLTRLLKDEVLPSLLVRQSVLIHVRDEGPINAIYTQNVAETQLPRQAHIPAMLGDANKMRLPTATGENEGAHLDWIRVVLPLHVKGKLIGLWLLGRRDPDDFYAQTEINVLRSIANQTAIALVNITQAEQLHTLYQADIERHEQERADLALDLHDEVLSQLAGISMKMDQETSLDFEADFQTVTTRLRQTIQGLRPAMLNYGLVPALEDLAEQLSARTGHAVSIEADITASCDRYDPRAEAHLYRIVQQACENALRHAKAGAINIRGYCDPEGVQLFIEDNGIGFANQDQLDFNQLLVGKHYGLANMFERAALIGAELRVDSTPEEGTVVSVEWVPEEQSSTPLAR